MKKRPMYGGPRPRPEKNFLQSLYRGGRWRLQIYDDLLRRNRPAVCPAVVRIISRSAGPKTICVRAIAMITGSQTAPASQAGRSSSNGETNTSQVPPDNLTREKRK